MIGKFVSTFHLDAKAVRAEDHNLYEYMFRDMKPSSVWREAVSPF